MSLEYEPASEPLHISYCRGRYRPVQQWMATTVRLGALWEGHRESRRCSRDTYPSPSILVYEEYRPVQQWMAKAPSYLRLIDFVYHSALGLRVINLFLSGTVPAGAAVDGHDGALLKSTFFVELTSKVNLLLKSTFACQLLTFGGGTGRCSSGWPRRCARPPGGSASRSRRTPESARGEFVSSLLSSQVLEGP